MSENGREHRTQNREVPYPYEGLKQHQDLENYFLDFTQKDQFIDFDALPESFTSGAIDTYASWMAELTAKDPQHRERSSFVLFNAKKEQFVFPPNPLLGDEKSAETLITDSPWDYYPFIRMHSHPDSSAFSMQDIKRSVSDVGTWGFQNDSFGELVATQRGNYLLLRTAQSEFFPPEDVDETMKMISEVIDKATLARKNQQVVLLKDLGMTDVDIVAAINKLEDKEREIFGSDIARLSMTANMTAILAARSRLGFYYSEGNGVFSKYDPERLAEMKKEADQLFYELLQES